MVSFQIGFYHHSLYNFFFIKHGGLTGWYIYLKYAIQQVEWMFLSPINMQTQNTQQEIGSFDSFFHVNTKSTQGNVLLLNKSIWKIYRYKD